MTAEDTAPQQPKDEVESLMAKYDNDEANKSYLQSDAYKQKLKAKADAEISKQ